jgi:dTDP-4-amino-4,6-dideoxy-D-galactose acyltransferase
VPPRRNSDEPCEYLPWDSEFFSVRIARLRQNRLAPVDVPGVLDWCYRHSVDCLYFLADEDPVTTEVAEQNGFRLTDVRVTLETSIQPASAGEVDARVRPAKAGDLPALCDIAAISHTDSRFYHDGHFAPTRCAEFYRTWIENSCAGWADQVYVAEHDGTAAGYITCSLNGAQSKIGLIAVAERARGTGFGRALVARVFDWTSAKGVGSVTVVTQERNRDALKFYQANGFRISSKQRWYHLWPREKHL